MTYNDNITIEKIWIDNEFFQVSVFCETNIISVSTNIYMNSESIDELHHQIKHFLDNGEENVYWQCVVKGSDSTPSISVLFSALDKLGHIQIEVYLELDDNSTDVVHSCCFFVLTEYGRLFDFNEKLEKLKEGSPGVYISLR